MKVAVVYESIWGNTAAIARAIAEGFGPEAIALSTRDATSDAIVGLDLLVAGAPVLGFSLPTDPMRAGIAQNAGSAPAGDYTSPTMRTWISRLTPGTGRSAAFETRIWWSLGGATRAIFSGLEAKGYLPLTNGARFIVQGKYGPLRAGELERAKAWGAELRKKLG